MTVEKNKAVLCESCSWVNQVNPYFRLSEQGPVSSNPDTRGCSIIGLAFLYQIIRQLLSLTLLFYRSFPSEYNVEREACNGVL